MRKFPVLACEKHFRFTRVTSSLCQNLESLLIIFELLTWPKRCRSQICFLTALGWDKCEHQNLLKIKWRPCPKSIAPFCMHCCCRHLCISTFHHKRLPAPKELGHDRGMEIHLTNLHRQQMCQQSHVQRTVHRWA